MDVDDPSRKLNFDEYSDAHTPKKKPRPQTEQPESTHLEVFLRIRPTNESKLSTAEYTLSNENKSIRLSSPNQSDIRNYSFDYIFDQNTTNTQVFDKIGKIAINRFLSGYSNLIFSYGITGSGKTHTIMGSNNKLDGLIPSILNEIFNHSLINTNNNNNNNKGKYSIFASYLENYTKDVFDLLDQNDISSKLTIRVLPSGVDIPDLRTMEITNVSDALELIEFGNNKRRQAHTKLNTNSSRSHALFILDLFENNNNNNNKLISQLCIVDLAGSESVKRTGFNPSDKRFIESCEINSSLSVLSRCIESIKDGALSVPWREQTLTKILYEYLTGNGYVNMIVNAHINNDDYNETIRAIEFGSNSQNITMNPVVNSVRMSTRHKSRIFNNNNNNNSNNNMGVPINHINYINSLKDIQQLKKIAIESYKTVFKSKYIIYNLRDKKIKQLDMLFNIKDNQNKIESIQEENENENDIDNNEKYKALGKQLAEKEIAFEEKIAEINHLYGELSKKNEMLETYKNKLLDRDVRINKYKMDGNEIKKLQNECNKYKEGLQRVNKNVFNMTDQICKFKERENELMVSKSKLEANVNRYKVVMDENEQKIERLGHMMRDCKEKLQKKCIEISEKDERLRKLKSERDKLEEDYSDKCGLLEKNINMFQKINDDARDEIVSLNKGNMDKDKKYKNMIKKCDELMNAINEKDKEIDVLNKYNLDINKQMEIKNKIINIKDGKIKELMDEINNKQYVNQLLEKMEVKNNEIEKLNKCNDGLKEEMNRKLNEMMKCMNSKDEEINKLSTCNDVFEDKMSKLNNEMIGKRNEWNSQCDEMKRCIKEKDDIILGLKKDKNDMEQEMVEQDDLIKSLTQYKIDKDREIEDNNNNIFDKDNKIKDMNHEINELKTILNEERLTNDKIVNDLYDKRDEKDMWLNKYKVEMDVEMSIQNEEIIKLKEQLKTEKEKNDKIIYELNNEIKELSGKLNNGNNELDGKTSELHKVKIGLSDMKHKLNDVLNEKNQLMRELNNIIHEKNQLVEHEKYIENEKNELMIKLSNCISEKNIIISKLNNITNEKNNKVNEWLTKYENLKLKYNKQYNILIQFKTNINTLNNELNNNKNNINKQIKKIENELQNEFNIKIKQFELIIIEMNTNKNNIIEEWKRKCSQYDMTNLELNDKYEQLQNKCSKEKEFHKIALKEADEQYIKAQNEISQLYELNCQLEKQKNEKIELEKHVNTLQQQLNDLKLKSLPPPHSNKSNKSNRSNSNKSNKTSRKRPRQEMENTNTNNNISNPNKKRKITVENNGVVNDDDDNSNINDGDNDIIIDNNDNNTCENDINNGFDNDIILFNNEDNDMSPSNSLEPKRLINELSQIDENKQIIGPEMNNNCNNKLISPVPSHVSHLSEGDTPLPKTKTKTKTRLSIGTIKQKQKQYKLMRTPATKQTQKRYSETPITKTGLRALRCVDLKEKLKKHSITAYGKKENLVDALFNHKNKKNKNNNEKDNVNDDDSDSDDDEGVDYEWIGKYISKCDGNTYYKGIRVNGNLDFYIGSACYVYSEDKNEEWMSKIIQLYEDEDGDAWMGNMWYWQYDEIIKAVKNSSIIKHKKINKNKEVFISCGHDPDFNHIALMSPTKQFKVFNNKNELEIYKKNNKKKKILNYFILDILLIQKQKC